MLKLSLFGSLSASLHSGNQIRPLALPARPAGLLAFLAIGRGRYFTRGQIIQSLWSESSSQTSVGSFNTALWRLRKSLDQPPFKADDYIVTNRQGALGLNGTGTLWLDLVEFERLTRSGLAKPIHQITPADQRDLEAALALRSGEFLADFTDPWALAERERYRRIYLNTLGRLMDIGAARRDYAASVRYGQTILDLEPLREDVHRELMRYFVLSGQRAMALKQFELCRHWLRRDLAIRPMPETMLLYQRIADSAIGRPEELERSLFFATGHPDADPNPETGSPDPGPIESGEVLMTESPAPVDAAHQIAEARRLIAQADQLLQLSLGLIRSETG